MSVVDQMMTVTFRCKNIDFTKVTRDQAAGDIKSLCPGRTSAQQDVVIKNVLGDQH